jgi:hypothetical protein
MARRSGKEFEERFARKMVAALGVSKTRRNEPVKGKTAARPWDCDIHGTIESPAANAVRWVAIVGYAVSMLAFVYPEEFEAVSTAGQAVEAAAASHFDLNIVGGGVFVLATAAAIVGAYAKRRTRRHVWVECKDLKRTVKRTDVIKLAKAAEDVRAFDGAEWKPNEVWIASTSNFDADALNFARESGIRCFVDDGGGPVEVSR